MKIKSGIKLAEISKSSENKTEYHTIVIRGLPYKIKKPMLKEFFKPLKLDSIRLPPKIKGVAYIGFKNKRDAEQCLIKNKSFLSIFILINCDICIFNLKFVNYRWKASTIIPNEK